jgi:hypothetical protein
MPHFESGHMSRFELLFCQRLKKKRFTLFRFTASKNRSVAISARAGLLTCTPCSMAVIPVASGRFERLKEVALAYAFALKIAGLGGEQA